MRRAIDAGVQALQRGEKVVVACDFGISRSNAIAAGILSRHVGRSYSWGIQEVIRATGEDEIKLELVETVRNSLGEGGQDAAKQAVLVTGGGGFIGRQLVARLQETVRVIGPPRSQFDLQSGAVSLADYCVKSEVAQIVHLAYPRNYTNVSSTGTSLQMLRTVLDVCRSLKIRLIYISDRVVFGGYPAAGLLADEALPLFPKGVYGETKYLEEMLVDLYHRRGEVERSICRFVAVYGPCGDRPRLIRAFHSAALEGTKIVTHRFRNGRPALDLLHVFDAADAIARVLSVPSNDVFHFGTGKLHETAEIAALIGRIAGRDIEREEIDIDDDTSNIAFRSTKAREMLGWEPRIGLEEGLASLLAR